MDLKNKKKLAALVFLLELELNRGKWDDETCVEKLLKLTENPVFAKEVKCPVCVARGLPGTK